MSDETERLRELVQVLVTPALLLVNAYAVAEDSSSVDWGDIDDAHSSAQLALEDNFDLQQCEVCCQYFVADVTECGCHT